MVPTLPTTRARCVERPTHEPLRRDAVGLGLQLVRHRVGPGGDATSSLSGRCVDEVDELQPRTERRRLFEGLMRLGSLRQPSISSRSTSTRGTRRRPPTDTV